LKIGRKKEEQRMSTMKTIGILVILIVTAVATAWAAPGDARFRGGSHDGWARCAMAESGSLERIPKGTVIFIR